MLDLTSFKNIFPRSLAKKLKESIIPHNSPIDRDKIAELLYREIVEYKYHPSTPRDYIVVNKANYVARIVPTFHPKDYFLYYFCTKILEDEIAVNYVDGTFGGWRLGNQIKIREENDQLEIIDSAPSNSYNPFLWTEHWSQFQKKAYEISSTGSYEYIVKLDIANFYDSINISLLGKKLYLASPTTKLFYIDLLKHFLANWNKKFEGYSKKSIGLPQDELSDSSRILANFYLQDYDKKIKEICNSIAANYLRYADDQLFYTKSKHDANYLVYEASKQLSRIGLNINTSKVIYFDSQDKFNEYWAFEIFDLLGDTSDKSSINKGIEKFLEWKDLKKSFREPSVLKRILNIDFSLFELKNRLKILALLYDKEFVCLMTHWMMSKIYNQLNDTDKIEFLNLLDELIDEYHFNSYHYNLMCFYRKNKITFDEKRILEIIDKLRI